MDLRQLNQLSDDELRALIDAAGQNSVSIIMPVQQEPDKWDENRIRLKNLLQAAEEELGQLDLRRPDVEQLLAPAGDLVEEGRFVATGGPGLAVFLRKGFSRAYQLPYAPEQVMSVSSQFYIKPLMPLRLDERFYVLALSQQEIRLLHATEYTVERVDLRDVPQSLNEALRWDDPERELQWHTQTGGQGNGRDAMFHGHGVGAKETHKKDLLRYFQLLDQHLSKVLASEKAPLVLAGVDYLLPIYREANTYGHLFKQGIEGSQEQLSDAEIQRRAWELVRPYFQKGREAAESLYHQQANKSLASADLATVLPASYQGRVDTLFVALDEQRWGRYKPEAGQVELHTQQQPGDVDLLNLATIHVVLNSGDVYAGQRDELPDAEPLASILRF
jgi:hypothetical protein